MSNISKVCLMAKTVELQLFPKFYQFVKNLTVKTELFWS